MNEARSHRAGEVRGQGGNDFLEAIITGYGVGDDDPSRRDVRRFNAQRRCQLNSMCSKDLSSITPIEYIESSIDYHPLVAMKQTITEFYLPGTSETGGQNENNFEHEVSTSTSLLTKYAGMQQTLRKWGEVGF
jgi:hypothetical protein